MKFGTSELMKAAAARKGYGVNSYSSQFVLKSIRTQFQTCHNFFVKKPKIFENVKSERVAANFQKSRIPRVSTIISKNSHI